MDLIIVSLTISAVAVLWRNLQSDNPKLKSFVMKLPQPFRKTLSCGLCFTYWLSFLAVLVIDPLADFSPTFRGESLQIFSGLINFAIDWMSVAIIATIIRFAYASLQELVHYLVHSLNQHQH